jgi:O-antigen ligase
MSSGSRPLTHERTAVTRAPALPLVVAGLALAIALAALPPDAAAFLLAAVALLVVALASPLAGFCLLPWAAAFGPALTLTVRGLHVTPLDALVAGLVLASVLRARKNGALAVSRGASPRAALSFAWRRDQLAVVLFGALLAYLAVVVLSLAVATDRASTVKEIVKWGEVLAVLASGVYLVRGAQQVRLIVWSAIAAGVAEAVVGYAQWVLAAGASQLAEGGRVFGTFGQPNPYAGYLNLSLPLALGLAVFSRDMRERIVAAAAAVLLLVAEALSASRGGLIGLAAAVVVLAAVGLRRERIAALLVGLGALLFTLAAFTSLLPHALSAALLRPLRLEGISPDAAVTNANFSTMERLAHWIAGLRMFAAHPLLGVGAGNYNAAYPRYAFNPSIWPEALGHAHNYYINVAAETGLLGLLAFLVFAGAALAAGWRATHPRQALTAPAESAAAKTHGASALTRAVALGLFAVLAGFLAHNLTDDLFLHGMDTQLALSIACLLVLCGYSRDAA